MRDEIEGREMSGGPLLVSHGLEMRGWMNGDELNNIIIIWVLSGTIRLKWANYILQEQSNTTTFVYFAIFVNSPENS